ncbi:MAG TPA: diguanylate cyclase, partial [Pyrinomonadaceae bacterium]|nr:diguanylate cyclase [Pyrinomonadaceae bacterium]
MGAMLGKFDVLVVDDDDDKLTLLSVALGMEGYNVRTAENGREALAAVESYPPDLIITDVMMPEMDGYELARTIRRNPQTKFIPLILQTAGRHDADDVRLGAEVGALGFVTDPTDLDLLLARARTLLDFKAHLDTWQEAAFTDHLSGLPNRRRLERQLEQEITRTLRYGHPFSLLMFDIDNFKKVNDTFGHDAGDEVIKILSKTLQEGIRGIDLAARIGGEEFAIILTETPIERALEVAERLRSSVKALSIPTVGAITVSAGVAEAPTCSQTARELLACADVALYTAKEQGRDRVVSAERNNANSFV